MLRYLIHVIGIISASYNNEDNEDPHDGFKASLRDNNRRNTGTNESGRWAGREPTWYLILDTNEDKGHLILMKIKGTWY